MLGPLLELVARLSMTSTVTLPAPPPHLVGEEQVARLEGHQLQERADGSGFDILDIAGEGAPMVGCVVFHAGELKLELSHGDYLLPYFPLDGPLAIPRIAGPDYKVWLIGDTDEKSARIEVRRLGIIAPPATSGCRELAARRK